MSNSIATCAAHHPALLYNSALGHAKTKGGETDGHGGQDGRRDSRRTDADLHGTGSYMPGRLKRRYRHPSSTPLLLCHQSTGTAEGDQL